MIGPYTSVSLVAADATVNTAPSSRGTPPSYASAPAPSLSLSLSLPLAPAP